MGVWGAGNFDSDECLDFVTSVCEFVSQEMVGPEDVSDIGTLMAAVEIHRVLAKYCHAPLPDEALLISLRDRVLSMFDARFDVLQPAKGFKQERRSVIHQTFEDFLALFRNGA